MAPGKIKLEPTGLTVKFDSKKFAKGSGEFVSDIFDFKFGSALKSARKAFNVETPVEGVAFTIIWAALNDGVAKIFSDSRFQEYFNNLEDAVEKHRKIKAQFYDLLDEGDYEIGNDFFSAPQELDFVKPAKEILKKWLQEEHGYSEMGAFNLSETLPLQFLRCLSETEKESIEKIKKGLENDFADAFSNIFKKESYHAKLVEEFNRPAFDDPKVLLSEMYVEPNFFVHEESISKTEMESGRYSEEESNTLNYPYFKKKNYQKNIHGFFLEWLKGNKQLDLVGEESQMLILLGQPGQGKTSFCQRTIHQLLAEGNNIIENLHFIKLRNIEKAPQLIADPMNYLRGEINNICFDSDKLLNRSFLKNGLLILDGLDELYMSQGLTQVQIHNFVKTLKEQIEKQKENWNLKVLITSRLNYLNFDQLNAKETLVIKLAELTELQQLEWLSKYKRHYPNAVLSKEKLKEINHGEEDQHEELRKLINQPILLQLIASADFAIDLKTNKAKIYDKLFDTILNRRWSKDGQLKMFKGLQEKKGKRQFRRFLRTLALEIFQSDHEYITRKEFIKEGSLKKSIDRLKITLEQPDMPTKELVKNLLVSFYFQEVNRDKKEKLVDEDHDFYAYEFLHKSLMEYLAAERIWESFKELLDKDSEGDYRIEDWQDVLKLITILCVPKIISEEIAGYLYEIVGNENIGLRIEMFKYLKKVFTPILNHGFLYKYSASEYQKNPFDISIACFYGFWTVLSSTVDSDIIPYSSNECYEEELSKKIKMWSCIDENNLERFSNILMLFSRNTDGLALNLDHQNLHNLILLNASFFSFHFNGADLSGANLSDIDFFNTNFIGSKLVKANLQRSDLTYTDFSGANFSSADLYGTILTSASLNSANLSKTDLRKTKFWDADLKDANLFLSNLRDADLRESNLSGTNLTRANLSNANLRGANLNGANLSNANFSNADLFGVKNIYLAKGLSSANFKGTIYEGKFKKEED